MFSILDFLFAALHLKIGVLLKNKSKENFESNNTSTNEWHESDKYFAILKKSTKITSDTFLICFYKHKNIWNGRLSGITAPL